MMVMVMMVVMMMVIVCRLVTALRQAGTNPQTYMILDARPKINAMGNQFKGKGFEVEGNYPNCRVLFMGIENIHQVRCISRTYTHSLSHSLSLSSPRMYIHNLLHAP